ncbi:hypothetical protein [Pseudarthrobacter sp. PH31-O2]|uniref:hypothetical protein n=1 Tax=Pseudarthrobacter sp. PH31-O2 TaxID=3046206 RepID=UPI0024B93374|nr:hypothetical protein [Pseudarthrobacter sp. PH31-O2]MDJ0351844.1 hypothetical protein [Pseudarthrobacter sp. PH31-O2]
MIRISGQEPQQGAGVDGTDTRLVTKQQEHGARFRVESSDAGGDRGGTARPEVRVEHNLAACGVDRAPDLPGRASQDQHGLLKAAVPGDSKHGVEEHPRPVGKQLLGPAQAPRRSGRQDQPRRPVPCGWTFRG